MVALSLIAGTISGAANAALLAMINTILRNNGSDSTNLVLGFIGLCLLLPFSRFISEALLNKLGQDALYKLRFDLCRKILTVPLFHLEKLGSYRLLASLTDDIPTITNIILAIPQLCINAAVTAGCLIYMGYLSWTLLSIVLGFMLLGILSYQLPIIKSHNVFYRARQDSDALQNHFRALTQGMKELKLHDERREEFFTEVLDATATSFRQHNLTGLNIYSAASGWGQTLVFIVIGLLIFVLPRMQSLNSITLTGYTLSLLYLMTPLQVIMNMLPGMSRAGIALNKINELGVDLATQHPEESLGERGGRRVWQRLNLRSITHTYHREGEPNDFTFGPINTSFRSGEMVFITGGNGSGKTTFIKLLTGLYLPENGRIEMDGKPITDHEREAYRQYFSVVFADFFLFDQLLGLNNETLDHRAQEYLEQLKLTDKVQVKNGKFSTVDLSQGQRKRLALLTAYLEDRPIYVFDEWAADQDPYFKSIFYLHLLPDLKSRMKTVIVISHDDRFYYIADRVIKLDEGQIVSDIDQHIVNKATPAT